MKIPTVKVKHRGSYVIMNESDFDPDRHELFDAEKPKEEPKKRGRKPAAKKEENPEEAAE